MKVKNLNLANLLPLGFGYASVHVIFGSGILSFEFYLGKIESGKNQIKLNRVLFK